MTIEFWKFSIYKHLQLEVVEFELQKYLAVHDGKLLREFEKLYDMLHIAGYYRGLLYDVTVVKDALRATRSFIEKVV